MKKHILSSKHTFKVGLLNSLRNLVLGLLAFTFALLTALTEARAQTSTTTNNYDNAPTSKTHTFVNPMALSFSNAQSTLFKGKYLTVYYGYGSPGSLKNQDDQITIREVRERKTYKITGSVVKISQVALKKVPINTAFSIVVFVVHDEFDFTWLNGDRSGPDGGLPKGETVSDNKKFYDTDYLSVIEIDSLREEQNVENKETELSYVFGSRL